MNKSQLVEAIASAANLTKADAEKAVNAFIDTIVSNVKRGNKVAISGLGSFERMARAERVGVNPSTGEKLIIKAKNAPKFKAAKAFKDIVALFKDEDE